MKKNTKLEAIRKKMPLEIKLMIDHSFAVVDRIDEIMRKKKISQRELAQLLGKSESEVSKWMRGTHNFTLKTIAKLEAVLDEPIFEKATKEPGIFVFNFTNESTSMPMAIRGEIQNRNYSGNCMITPSKSEISTEELAYQLN